jgi:hypothetical protein
MPNEVEKHLKPAIDQRYAIVAGRLLLDGMKNWIAAAQLYRHVKNKNSQPIHRRIL